MGNPRGSSSRLLEKIADGVKQLGPGKFEKAIDNIVATAKSKRKFIPTDPKAELIIEIIAEQLEMDAQEVREGSSEYGKFAQNLCIYFFCTELKWVHRRVSQYLRYRSHTKVSRAFNYINNLSPVVNMEELEHKKRIEGIVLTRIKKKSYG